MTRENEWKLPQFYFNKVNDEFREHKILTNFTWVQTFLLHLTAF